MWLLMTFLVSPVFTYPYTPGSTEISASHSNFDFSRWTVFLNFIVFRYCSILPEWALLTFFTLLDILLHLQVSTKLSSPLGNLTSRIGGPLLNSYRREFSYHSRPYKYLSVNQPSVWLVHAQIHFHKRTNN